MAVPTSVADLSVVISSNSPAGNESVGSPGKVDDYFRAHAGIIAQVNAAKADLASPTFTGTVTLPATWKIGSTTITATAAQINYLADVTSPIQAQLDSLAGGGTGGVTDPELLAIAAVTSAANKLPYFTGSGTADVADLTAAGRALLDDTTAAAQLTTLGAAPLASPTFTGTVTIPGGVINAATVGVTTPAEGAFTRATESMNAADNDGTFAVNWANGGSSSTYTGGAITATFSNVPATGRIANHLVYVAKFNSVTWPAAVTWGKDGKPSIASSAVVMLVTVDGGTTVYAGVYWRED
jgi:hypothetical protein